MGDVLGDTVGGAVTYVGADVGMGKVGEEVSGGAHSSLHDAKS